MEAAEGTAVTEVRTRFAPSPTQAVDIEKHSWANYFLAAYKGVYAHLEAVGVPMPVTGLKVRLETKFDIETFQNICYSCSHPWFGCCHPTQVYLLIMALHTSRLQ